MTRAEDRMLKEAMQKSAEVSAASSSAVTSSTFSRIEQELSALGAQGGDVDSPHWTGATNVADYPAGSDNIPSKEGAAFTDSSDTRLTRELSLAVTDAPDQGRNFFSSSPPEVDAEGTEATAMSTPAVLQQPSAILAQASSANRYSMPEVLIEVNAPHSLRGASADGKPSSERSARNPTSEHGSTKKRKSDVVLQEEEKELNAPSPSKRPQRRAAKERKSYAAEVNKDGTLIKKRTNSAGRSTKSPSASSSKSLKLTGETIEISDDERTGGAVEGEPSRRASRTVKGSGLAETNAAAVGYAESTVAGVDDEEEEVSVRRPRRGTKRGAGTSTMFTTGEEDEEAEAAGGNVAEGEGPAPSPERAGKIDGEKDRGKAKVKSKTKTKTKAKQSPASKKRARQDSEEEEEESDEAQNASGEAEVGVESSKEATEKTRALADASSAVNAGLKKKSRDDAGSSASSSTVKSRVIDSAKKFWGKPLTSILGSSKARMPGLKKVKTIVPLLAIRREPPPVRITRHPVKKKKEEEEELDSDEERARANETPEQRMARIIREYDEDY